MVASPESFPSTKVGFPDVRYSNPVSRAVSSNPLVHRRPAPRRGARPAVSTRVMGSESSEDAVLARLRRPSARTEESRPTTSARIGGPSNSSSPRRSRTDAPCRLLAVQPRRDDQLPWATSSTRSRSERRRSGTDAADGKPLAPRVIVSIVSVGTSPSRWPKSPLHTARAAGRSWSAP